MIAPVCPDDRCGEPMAPVREALWECPNDHRAGVVEREPRPYPDLPREKREVPL